MPRDLVPLTIPDLSAFAKTLRAGLPQAPSHLEMLGMIAKAAGYRNYQHLRAAQAPVAPVDDKRITRCARYFDAEGRLIKWPSKTSLQHLCLWVIWARLPARHEMDERSISALIDALSTLQDAAQIRRSLVEMRRLTRTRDGSVYRRIEGPVPPDARALMQRVMR